MLTRKRIVLSILIISCLFLTGGLASIAQEGQIVRETVYSPSLEGNLLGDSPKRAVTIYLPPSYEIKPDRRYPVVYLLHGYYGNHNSWVGGYYGNIIGPMKSWLKNGKVKEMILIMPNSYTKLRGSYYSNSIATGNWGDFIAKDLVEYIDSHYRTLSQRESRAVIGHSMGGYGAVKIGMLYPEVFGCMGGLAGGYDLEYKLKSRSSSYAYASTIKDWVQFNSLGWTSQICFTKSAAFIPNPERPPFYCDFPFVYTDTKPKKIVKVQEAYNKFMEHDILRMVDRCLDGLLNMRAIYIECGINDSIDPIEESRKLHEKLASPSVEHIYKEFPGDHMCCVITSTGNALEVFSNAMAFEMVVDVQSVGKLSAVWGSIKQMNR